MGEEGQEPETRGHRVYLIREALGTRRQPLPLEQFAALIEQATGVAYDTSILSRMETGKRKVSIEDIEAIAPVDPLKRGRSWLAGWDDEAGSNSAPAPNRTVQFANPDNAVSVPRPQPAKRRKSGG